MGRVKLLAAGVVVAAVIVNQSAVHWRADLADSDLFAYFGWCITQGARPYVDIWDNKPPGIWWANAAAIRWCGPGAGSDLLLGSAALLVMLAASLGIARAVYHRRLLLLAALVGAALLTDVRFESGGNRTETLVAACECLIVLAYLHWLRRRRTGWLVLGGLAAGAAPLFKQAGLAATLACALHLAWLQWHARRGAQNAPAQVGGWRPWLIAGAAFCVAPLLAVLTLAREGALGQAAFAVGRFNQAYFAVQDATWTRLDRAIEPYMPALAMLARVLVLVACGLLGWWITRLRWFRPNVAGTWPRRGVGLLALWLLFGTYLALVGPGRRSYHLMPILPPLALLALLPLQLLSGRRGLRATLTARPAAAGVVVVYAYVLILHAVGGAEGLARCWRTKPSWYALHTTVPTSAEQHAAAVDALTQPGDTMYVWGWGPAAYRYACRLPASRYATLEKPGQLGAYARFIFDGARADLQRAPPKVIVISPDDYRGLTADSPDEFGTWLMQRYDIASTVASAYILLQRAQ